MGNLLKTIGINKYVGSVVNPVVDGSISIANKSVDAMSAPLDLLKSTLDNPSTMTIILLGCAGVAVLFFLKK